MINKHLLVIALALAGLSLPGLAVAVDYSTAKLELSETLNGIKDLHKNMQFVYGPEGTHGAAAYLTPDSRLDIAVFSQSLFYGHPPAGAKRRMAGITRTLEYGIQMSRKRAISLMESLAASGVQYAQDTGHTNPLTLSKISTAISKQIIGHQQMVLPSQVGTYYSTAEKVFSSPRIGVLHATPAQITQLIGATVRAGYPNTSIALLKDFSKDNS
ncbi:hypothetical protein A6M27_09800 [Acidithiobacillus thiooxidans]|uniref:Uncharacterized protein n=1 Tax=Acidithiobacillus thiooxidans TaxID=930 RepID=A0A1C2II04_ACITH|nr:hypothetical protein [Acidithiobacillus thiooxidans]OCX74442.1 hypothetical protein A6P07_05485 [Acidithiobacillus thiooxidans]OCX75614.1 hypothetical protein A6O24_09685 [Acidithiobacillus thiooxidans]OCX81696.1 hypothetical protein A6O26_12460 [Acidithiobacillus thiooxidans]OCX87928.1 hypothetical protein A6M27_09800 [Acidithiobacillus thiooxidans]